MTTEVPSGLSNSSIDPSSSALANASMVLSVGSEVPDKMSATVPRPSPAVSASARMVVSPRAFMSTRVRAATSNLASVRADFRTLRAVITLVSTTSISVTAYTCVIQMSGIPRIVSQPSSMFGSNTRSEQGRRA